MSLGPAHWVRFTANTNLSLHNMKARVLAIPAFCPPRWGVWGCYFVWMIDEQKGWPFYHVSQGDACLQDTDPQWSHGCEKCWDRTAAKHVGLMPGSACSDERLQLNIANDHFGKANTWIQHQYVLITLVSCGILSWLEQYKMPSQVTEKRRGSGKWRTRAHGLDFKIQQWISTLPFRCLHFIMIILKALREDVNVRSFMLLDMLWAAVSRKEKTKNTKSHPANLSGQISTSSGTDVLLFACKQSIQWI